MDDVTKRTKRVAYTPKSVPKGKKIIAKSKIERRRDVSQTAMSVVLQATGLSELKPAKSSQKKRA